MLNPPSVVFCYGGSRKIIYFPNGKSTYFDFLKALCINTYWPPWPAYGCLASRDSLSPKKWEGTRKGKDVPKNHPHLCKTQVFLEKTKMSLITHGTSILVSGIEGFTCIFETTQSQVPYLIRSSFRTLSNDQIFILSYVSWERLVLFPLV